MIAFKYRQPAKFILKIGTKVRIKKNLEGGLSYGGVYFSPYMEKLCGKITTIVDVKRDRFILGIDREWVWSKEMLENPHPTRTTN